MSEDPVSRCQECGAPVERVFHPVAVHFKGSGFYTTDYARARSDGKGDAEKKKDGSKEKSGDSGSAKTDSGSDKAKASSSGD